MGHGLDGGRKPLSKRSPSEMYQLLRVNDRGEYMADTLVIDADFNGFPVKLSLELSPDDWANPDFAPALAARIDMLGLGAPVAPVAQAAPAAQKSDFRARIDGDVAGSGGGCATHGLEFQTRGFKGKGFQCSAKSGTQQAWTKDKPFVTRDGTEQWYCASTWG